MYAHLVAIAHAAATTESDRARCLDLLERARELDAKRNNLPHQIRALRKAAGITFLRSDADMTADPVLELDVISACRDRLMELHHRPYNARSMLGHIISMIKLEPTYPTVDGRKTAEDYPASEEYQKYLEDTMWYLMKKLHEWPV